MKEKSQIEKKAEEKQTELLSAALGGCNSNSNSFLFRDTRRDFT